MFAHALSWSEEEGTATYVGGAANRVVSAIPNLMPLRHEASCFSPLTRCCVLKNAAHPVFNLTITHADGMLAHFYGQTPPSRYPPRAKK